MPNTRQARGRPPASGRSKSGGSSRPRGRPSGRSNRGASVVVKLPHVGARTAMRTSRRIPHRRSVEEEEEPPPPPPPESDTDAAEEIEHEPESLPPVAAYEEHQAGDDSATEEDLTAVNLAGGDSGGRRSRTSAARSDYIKRRFLYGEEEAAARAGATSPNRHRGRHPRDPRSGHHPGRRGRKPRHKPEEMVEDEDPDVDDMSPLRIDESETVRRRGRRRRSEMEDEARASSSSGLVKRSRRWGGRRREEEELIQVDDVGLVIGSESVEQVRRHGGERRRGRGRPPKPRSHLFVHDDLVSSHHDLLRVVSPSAGAVTGQSSPGMAEYEDDDEDDEEEMKEVAAAYGTTDFGDDEGLLSPSDESPVLVSRHGVRPARSGYEIEDDEDFDDIEEASALVYGRPPRNAPTMSPGVGRHHHVSHHPHSHSSPPPHPSLTKKYSRRHKMPSASRRPAGVPGAAAGLLDPETGTAPGPQGHHMAMHGPGGHGQVPGPVVGVTSGSGRESVKSEDDMDDEFMFEEGAAFTADNDPPVGGEGTTTGLSHTTHHGPMTGLPGPWSAGRRKTPLKPLTAGGPRSSDLDIFMGISEEEGIMPMGAPRGEHSYSAMAQKGAAAHGAGLQDMDYYPPAATQQYVEPPPDSHVPPPLNKPSQHRHGRNSSRRPSILPRRTALPRQRQPSICAVESGSVSAEPETSGASVVVEMPVVVSEAEAPAIPVTSAGSENVETSELLPAVTTSATAPVTSQAGHETEPSPAVAASASAKLFHMRNLKRKEEQEKAAAALNTGSGGLPMEAIPPEGAVLVAGIPAFRVAPGGLSILRRIPSSGAAAAAAAAAAHAAVTSTTSPTNATVKTVLGAANQQQPLTTTASQLSTGAATPAGDAWLKSKNMRIVVFRNEKGEQKTVVMPEDGSMRRIVPTGSTGQLAASSTSSAQPFLVQSPPQQSQQISSQQFVTIQQPQGSIVQQLPQQQQQQPQPQQPQQPIRYVKIINPGSGTQAPPVGGLLKK